jgi:hypothetical protein
MKRTVLTILLFLLLGAIMNIAVAYACFLFAGTLWSAWEEPVTELPVWVEEHSVIDYDGHTDWARYGFGIEHHTYFRGSFTLTQYSRAGWPFRVICGGQFEKSDGAAICVNALKVPTLASMHPPAGVWYIPIGVESGGLIVNTAVYGGFLYLVVRGTFVLRRHIRVKSGRCPKCGYDLRGAPSGGGGCPECGWRRIAGDGDSPARD